MKQYLDMLQHIKENGERKNNRTGIDAFTVAGYMFQHDMAKGFPLLTTKKMYTKAILVELEGFIKGITDKRWYQERGCKIWDEWCNPEVVEYNPVNNADEMKQCRDLGPIYGYQWRYFNGDYVNGSPVAEGMLKDELNNSTYVKDQLSIIVDKLKNNPNDRRMVCSAWNPQQLSQQALPSCHVLWHVTVINGKLNLSWFQRSCDAFLGVPFNIASYATLLCLLVAESGLELGTLTGFLSDLHIYENHMDQVNEQLSREPRALPQLVLNQPHGEDFSIFTWDHKSVEFANYEPHPAIKASVAI